MDEQQIMEIFSDPAFVDSLLEMDNILQVQKALADKGLDLTLDEIGIIKASLDSQEGELNDDLLEHVVGGSVAAVCGLLIAGVMVGGLLKAGKALGSWTCRW